MSVEMARKKKEDEEAIETMKAEVATDVQNDRCPVCGTPSLHNKYFDAKAMAAFQWIECNVCGAVYCPESIRKRKMKQISPVEAPSSPIIVPR